LSQPIDTAGRTYAPVRWLPSVRKSGRARPQATLREDAITTALVVWTLIALFWDGIVHNNITGQDTFFSEAHIAMYLGLIATGVWIAVVMTRHQDDLRALDLSAVPHGYGLAIIALPLAAIAGPMDFMWHSAYGFENQIDSAYSPPHQGLFIAGALLGAITAASAWHRADAAPSLRNLLPAIFSMTSVIAVMLFITHQLVPFYVGMAATQDFQDDIAGRADAYQGGSGIEHSEGLADALIHYGDGAFPFYFYSTHHLVGGILLFTAVLIGALLFMRRRWLLPMGAFTVMCTSLGLLYAMLSEYRDAELILPLVVAGVAGDLLLRRLAATETLVLWRVRLLATVLPVVLWAVFFLTVELLQGGLGWHATLWVGVIVTSAGLGFAVSLLAFPPPVPANSQVRSVA
jgi:hypothetical protein